MTNFYFRLSFFTLVLFSCNNNKGCKQISLSKENKEWFNGLKGVDSLLFQSDRGNIDTFVVKEVASSYTQCNKFELGENQYESFEFVMKQINRKCFNPQNNRTVWIKFFKDVTNGLDNSSQKNFSVFDFESDWFVDFSLLEKDSITLSTDKKRYDIYFFHRNGEYNEDGTKSYVKAFYWSKNYGLLRYELNTGETFEFFKKW